LEREIPVGGNTLRGEQRKSRSNEMGTGMFGAQLDVGKAENWSAESKNGRKAINLLTVRPGES
jgi:hypothetical protein